LDIVAISLIKVTEQYLDHIRALEETKVEYLMDFLVIGAKLILIKSRALLPEYDDNSAYEADDEEDPADALANQLRVYRRFKSIAHRLQIRESLGQKTYLRIGVPQTLARTPDLTGISLRSLTNALNDLHRRSENMQESVAVAMDRRLYTIDKQIETVRQKMTRRKRFFFDDLLSDNVTWIEISTTFLAILEMIKRQELAAYQDMPFGRIEITALSPIST